MDTVICPFCGCEVPGTLEGHKNAEDCMWALLWKVSDIREYVSGMLAEIDGDPRHHYKPALVDINAPLALIQVELAAKEAVLKRVLALLDGE